MIEFSKLKGLNLGGWLSQSDFKNAYMKNYILPQDFTKIRNFGFNNIRIPFDATYFFTKEGIIDEKNWVWIDYALQNAIKNDLICILDLHSILGHNFHTPGQNFLWSDKTCQRMFMNIWKNIARKYTGQYLNHLIFDVLNEPTISSWDTWKNLAQDTINYIRKYDTTRYVILNSHLKSSPSVFNTIHPCDDPYITYGFHFYDPMIFTHQNAEWSHIYPYYKEQVKYPGTPPSKAISERLPIEIEMEVHSNFDINFLEERLRPVLNFQKKYKKNVYCGEFGVYLTADIESKCLWIKDLLKLFSIHGIGWSYWNYRDMGFGLVHSKNWGEFSKLQQYQNKERMDYQLLKALING